MDSGLYFHGYDYTTGVLQLGAPCVAPIVELRNGLCEALVVSWVSRALLAEQSLVLPDASLDGALVNTVRLCPGETALLTSFFASAAPYLSILRLQSDATGDDVYVLNFTAERGYFFSRVLKPCSCPSAQAPGSSLEAFTTELLQGATFALNAYAAPPRSIWANALVFPVRAVKAPLTPALPCLAAA